MSLWLLERVKKKAIIGCFIIQRYSKSSQESYQKLSIIRNPRKHQGTSINALELRRNSTVLRGDGTRSSLDAFRCHALAHRRVHSYDWAIVRCRTCASESSTFASCCLIAPSFVLFFFLFFCFECLLSFCDFVFFFDSAFLCELHAMPASVSTTNKLGVLQSEKWEEEQRKARE